MNPSEKQQHRRNRLRPNDPLHPVPDTRKSISRASAPYASTNALLCWNLQQPLLPLQLLGSPSGAVT
ncbi:hypothetical protein ACFX13_039002 [Malus domestica]